MILPLWLQAEARRVLRQMDHPVARSLAVDLDLGATSRAELARAAVRALAKQPAVRELADRVLEDLEVLRQAEQERREGKR